MPRSSLSKSLILVAILLCAVPARADDSGEARRHVEPLGGFSFIPPDGWQVREFPGMKYKIAHGRPVDGFAPNINVVDEPFPGSLDEYAKANLVAMAKAFKDFRVISQETFETTSGEPGVRIIYEATQNGLLLRQSFHCFGKDDMKFVVTCSTLAEGGEKLDDAFKACINTFRFEE